MTFQVILQNKLNHLKRKYNARLRRPYKYFAFFLAALVVVAIIAVIIYFLVKNNSDSETFARGAVVTNGYKCGKIGAEILKKGGTAVEAAIAALFCEGVSMPQSMGLGGGFLMTIYDREKGEAYSLNARETAPAAADKDMFGGKPELSTKGGLAVAIPGELKGYWEAYHRFGGKTPWRDLVQPTIDLCKDGIEVTEYLARLFASEEENIKKDSVLSGTFIDPTTEKAYLQGQKVKWPKLAETLELIADQGADVFYNGTLTERFVQDIKSKNGIITVEDMNNYTVKWQTPIKLNLSNEQTMYTAPLPGSGVILGFIMNILHGFLDTSQPTSVKNWQRIIESFKYGYGKRTELADPDFEESARAVAANLTSPTYAESIRNSILDTRTFQDPEHYGARTVQASNHGTAHLSVLAPNGDAVAVTSTINLYFGAGFMSESTGIIPNDEMDDFSSPNMNNSFDMPPSEANFIKPGKRPLSSMCPTIVVGEDGEVVLVVGAAGGTKITTAVAQVTVKNLLFDIPIQEAVTSRRIHHQLFPMEVKFEKAFENDMEFVKALHDIGHEYEIVTTSGFSSVTSISRKSGHIEVATDPRRSGDTGFIY